MNIMKFWKNVVIAIIAIVLIYFGWSIITSVMRLAFDLTQLVLSLGLAALIFYGLYRGLKAAINFIKQYQ